MKIKEKRLQVNFNYRKLFHAYGDSKLNYMIKNSLYRIHFFSITMKQIIHVYLWYSQISAHLKPICKSQIS